MQLETGCIGIQIGGNDDYSAAGSDAVPRGKPCRAGRQHDAGQIIVAKHCRLLDHSGGKYHGAGAHLRHARLLRQRDPVIRVVAGGNGSRKQRNGGRVAHRPDQRRRRTIAGEPQRFIRQGHLRAGLRRGERGRQAAWAAADHQHIAETVALGGGLARGAERNPSQSRERAEHALPAGEQSLGMKRLVIETHRQ
jgi:hypothetical protein